jgi:hypothetical protein
MLKFNQFVSLILEGGNAIQNSRPLTQSEVEETYKWVVNNIYPLLKLSESDGRPIGSFLKKALHETSGDIDIAILLDAVAGNNGIALNEVLEYIKITLKSYNPVANKGLGQCSIAVPISGRPKLGLAQVDLMLTDNLEFSRFMYYSPDFRQAESKYKGLYRNILLMQIIGHSKREITKVTDKGETAQYRSFVLRMNQGIVQVTKSFEGAKGLVKTAKLLSNQDKWITNTPEVIAEIAFGPEVQPTDIMTFEAMWDLIKRGDWIHRDKLMDILKSYHTQLVIAKVPIPSECVQDYPNIFNI